MCAAMLALSVAVFVSRASAQKDCVMANCMDCGVVSARRKDGKHLLEIPIKAKWMVCKVCWDKLTKARNENYDLLPKEKEYHMDYGHIVEGIKDNNLMYLRRTGKVITVVPEAQALVDTGTVYVVTKLGGSENLDNFNGSIPRILAENMGDAEWTLFSLPINCRKAGTNIPFRSYDNGWGNESPVERMLLMEALKGYCPEAQLKDGKILFVKTKEPSGYQEASKKAGWNCFNGWNMTKRSAELLKGQSIEMTVPLKDLNIVFVTSKDPMLIDGCNSISRTRVELIRREVFLDNNKKDAKKIMRRMGLTNQYNVRVHLPVGCEHVGVAKGDYFVVDMKEDFRIGVPSIKKELIHTSLNVVITMEPNGGKERSHMNSQHMVVNPALYGLGVGKDLEKSLATKWQDAHYASVVADVKADKVHGDCEDLLNALEKGKVERSNTVTDQFKLADWYKVMGTVRSVPSLLLRVSKAHLAKIVDLKNLDVRIEIPNSVYGNLISESMANLILGAKTDIKNGECQYLSKWKVLVITDADYRKYYATFGGCDGDDKFSQLWRIDRGTVVVYCHRNPSGRGEGAVFTFVGDVPKCVDVSTLEELGVMPLNLSQLPPVKDLSKPAALEATPHTWEDFLRSLSNVNDGVGVLVNCVRLRDMSYEGRNEFCASTESMIDVCRMKNRKLTEECYGDVFRMVMALVNDKTALIDGRLWPRVRGIFKSGKEFETVTKQLEADKRFHESWFNEFCIRGEEKRKEAVAEIIDEIDAGRRYVDFGAIANSLPLDAKKMVADRFKAMVRCFWYLKTDEKTGNVLPIEWVKAGAKQEVHMEELRAQFVKWGLDPELQLFAALGAEANKNKFKDEHILLRKGIWESYLATAVNVSTPASV